MRREGGAGLIAAATETIARRIASSCARPTLAGGWSGGLLLCWSAPPTGALDLTTVKCRRCSGGQPPIASARVSTDSSSGRPDHVHAHRSGIAAQLAKPADLLADHLALATLVAGSGHAGITRDTPRPFLEVLVGISLLFVVASSFSDYSQLRRIVVISMLAGFAVSLIGVVLRFVPQPTTVRLLSTSRVFHYPSGWEC